MDPVFKGILTGLVLSFYVGATFFLLVETSITRGFRAALLFDAGIIVSDICCVLLVYFFTSEILNTVMQNIYVGMFGGVAFIGFGINYLVGHQRVLARSPSPNRMLRLVLSGFIINLLNPSVIVFWLGTLAVSVTHFQFDGKEIFLYFAATIIIVAAVDILKIYSACWLRSVLTPRIIKIVYLLSGTILILFGILVIYSKIKEF
jgi:threonine/homoserine/homoserine lactone efflux protein